MLNNFVGSTYRNVIKPILFRFDPEDVHVNMTNFGEVLGKSTIIKKSLRSFFVHQNPILAQTVAGIDFAGPIGLSAGFDYDAKLTQILPHVGFGFQTVGTITFQPYEGNKKPRLGRLPKSKSLMVNKGFKNQGALIIAQKLQGLQFSIPLGISIGRTNDSRLSQKESIEDIVYAFEIFEYAKLANAYYELNISCPNLYGNVSFYEQKKLDDLLTTVDSLHIAKPIFIKMPISCTNEETLQMGRVIVKHNIAGVIIGNLQKDRNNRQLVKSEVEKFSVGNFSGKPTFERSNELISLLYKHFGKKLIIIGCGGVFNARDAYAKIKKGASLVQLITGLIFQGPQLISEINNDLITLLQKDGFSNIQEAIGTEYKYK